MLTNKPTQEKIDEELNSILDQIKGLKEYFLNKGWDISRLQEIFWTTSSKFALFGNLNRKHTIGTKESIDKLTLLYGNDNGREWSKLLLAHNGFAFEENAKTLAQKTLRLLLDTKDIEIYTATRTRGKFEFKLLEPYDWIEYVECTIIKDRV